MNQTATAIAIVIGSAMIALAIAAPVLFPEKPEEVLMCLMPEVENQCKLPE